MSDKSKHKKSFLKSLLKKLSWIIGFTVLFMILSLKVVERFPQPLKEGFENYFASLSGRAVSVTELQKITFFPSLNIQMRDIVFSDAQNVAITAMTIEKVKTHIPFLNMFFGGRYIYDFEIRHLNAKAEVLTPQEIQIDVLDIIPVLENEEQGVLVVSGLYSQQPLSAQIILERKKTLFGHVVYKIPQSTTMELMIGEVTLKTGFVNENNEIWLRDGELSIGEETVLIKDSALAQRQRLQEDNIMTCLLDHDYKNIDEICETYIKDENKPDQP